MRCPHCKHKNAADFLFCEQCGEMIQQKCPECGRVNPLEYKFCEECGHALAGGPAIAPKPISEGAGKVRAARQPKRTKKTKGETTKVRAASQTVQAPQVVIAQQEQQKKRTPAWIWLLFGFVLGPLCLCSLFWYSIVPLPANARESVAWLPDPVGEAAEDLVQDTQQRQEASPPVIGGKEGTAGERLIDNLCDNWPFPWMPFNCPGDGGAVAAAPVEGPAPVDDAGPAPAEEDPPPLPPVPPDPIDLCEVIPKYVDLRISLWDDGQGNLYVNFINSDTFADLHMFTKDFGQVDLYLSPAYSDDFRLYVNECSLGADDRLTCQVFNPEEWADFANAGGDLDLIVYADLTDAQGGSQCPIIEDSVPHSSVPAQPQVDGQQAEPPPADEEEEEEAACSEGYYQVPGKPSGFCCPNGTTYNESTGLCDY